MHMPVLPAVLVSLTLAARAGSQDPADPVGPDTIELATEVVRVPFELARSRPVPVVEAHVNGRGPFRFFLDTGASGCVLDTSLMSELGLVSQGKTEVGDPSRNEPLQADVLRIEELELGGLRARGLPAVAFDRGPLDRGDGVRGVLGLSLFTRHLLTLDYGASALFVRAGALDPAAPHVVPFELAGVPRVLIDVDGVLLEATIDSGSPSGISLPHAFAEEHEFLEPLAVIARGRTVNSEFVIRAGRLDGDVSLAGHVFADPFVQTNELFDHVNLGYEVLRHFALTIDLAQHLAAFERRSEGALEVARPAPAQAAPAAPAGGAGRRALGARLAPEPAGLRVAGVDPGSEAERAGLRAGDLVVAVRGEPAGAGGTELLARALMGQEPIALRVERDGQARELVLFPRAARRDG